MMELLTGENLLALLTLTTLEIVLGIDNLVVSVRSARRFSPVSSSIISIVYSAGSANAITASPGSDQPCPPAATTTNWRPS